MKKYLKYLIKKNVLPLCCMALFFMLVYVVPILVNDYAPWNNEIYDRITLYLDSLSTGLMVLAVLTPIYMLSYKMNRRSTDMYYSLPMSRTKILVCHFLVGLIMLFSSYSAVYVLGFIVVLIKIKRLFLIYYLWFYLASIIPILILYTVTAFIYTRANTEIDGLVSLVGVALLLYMVVGTLESLSVEIKHSSDLSADYFFPFIPLNTVGESFSSAVAHNKITHLFNNSNRYQYSSDMSFLINGLIWTAAAIASTIGLIMTEKFAKAENCTQISNSIFCYKIMIPIYVFLFSVMATLEMEFAYTFIFLCAIAFAAYILSVLYKRSFRIGWKYSVVLISCMVGGIIIALIFTAIPFGTPDLSLPAKFCYWVK